MLGGSFFALSLALLVEDNMELCRKFSIGNVSMSFCMRNMIERTYEKDITGICLGAAAATAIMKVLRGGPEDRNNC